MIENTFNQNLIELIHHEIKKNNGYISFARFMELALYAPGLGYYSAGAYKFGKQGDFVTAPEISPLFAKCIAHQTAEIFSHLKNPDFFELGAGTGIFAKDFLLELETLNQLPNNYFILEVSGELRDRQQKLFAKEIPQFLSRITWLNTLPKNFTGVIFANEVMDAMPVNIFRIENQTVKERCVTVEKNQFAWISTPPTTQDLIDKVKIIQQENFLTDGYESEINLLITPWINSLANTLNQGVILLFDYGYGRTEYYHPDRSCGTLMCFHQHHRHSNPLINVGTQDITSHVDFTTVAESAVDAKLNLCGYTTQSAFLLTTGLMDLARQDGSEKEKFQQNQGIKKLILPSEMGELVKVMGISKHFDGLLKGFQEFDRRKDL